MAGGLAERAVTGSEAARLAALARFDILDTPAEQSFDRITALVRAVFGVPMAAVSLVDHDRQWFKSHPGIDASQTPRNIAFCDHTIRAGAPFVVADARADARFADNPLVRGAPHIGSYAGVPLTSRDGFHVGTLCALGTAPRAFSDDDLAILSTLGAIVADELELRRIARFDHLTGVLARRAFTAEATRAIARRDRHDGPTTLLLFDLDHFKAVNDRGGHAAGDLVLRAVTDGCAALLRQGDLIGRLGGEEFGVLLPEVDAGGALAAANRFRAGIEALAPQGWTITASFGVAPLTPDIATPETWLADADAALFAAKRGGRNTCRLTAAYSAAA